MKKMTKEQKILGCWLIAVAVPFVILFFNIFIYDFLDKFYEFCKEINFSGGYLNIISFGVAYFIPSILVFLICLPTSKKIKSLNIFVYLLLMYPVMLIAAVITACEFKGSCL